MTTQEFIDTLDCTIETKFVPLSKSGRDWECFSWDVTIRRNGGMMKTTFSRGTGILSDRLKRLLKQMGMWGTRHTLDSREAMNSLLENGFCYQDNIRRIYLDPPTLLDVLPCMVSDASANSAMTPTAGRGRRSTNNASKQVSKCGSYLENPCCRKCVNGFPTCEFASKSGL